VRELIRLTGHPLDIALDVMQGTGKAGLAIPAEQIDLDSFADIKNLSPELNFEFLIGREEDGKRWIEDQLLTPLLCYIVTTSAGKLALRSMLFGEVTDSITEDHALETPQWDAGFGDTINRLRASYDYQIAGGTLHPASSEYGSRQTYDDPSLEENDDRPMDITLRGLRTSLLDAPWFLGYYAQALFSTYRTGPATLRVRTMLKKHTIEQGDFIELTHSLVPDKLTGTVGLTAERCIVLERQPNFSAGYVEFVLQLAGVTMFPIHLIAKVALAQVAGAGGVFAWENPTDGEIIIDLMQLYITAGQSGQTMDVGRAADGTTSSDNLLDGVSIASVNLVDNIDNKGASGVFGLVVNSTLGNWITGTASGTPSTLAGYAYIHYHLV